jgi:hypothetical protein
VISWRLVLSTVLLTAAILFVGVVACQPNAKPPPVPPSATLPTVAPFPTLPPYIGQAVVFGDGSYSVGPGPDQFPPGDYHTPGKEGSPGCYIGRHLAGRKIVDTPFFKGPRDFTVKFTDLTVDLLGGCVWMKQ